jgi:hypothetical protein
MSIENQQFGVCWSTSIDHQVLGCRVIEDNPRIIVLTMKHMGALINYGWLTVEVRYQNLSFRGIFSRVRNWVDRSLGTYPLAIKHGK